MISDENRVLSFIGEENVLIVDPSQTFSYNLLVCFKEFKIPLTQIKVAKRFDEAKKFIMEKKPKVIVTEYEFEGQMGFSLVELQEQFHDELSRLAIVATQNNSDSVIAQAAEEKVDIILLKPFSSDSFKLALIKGLNEKLRPSSYAITVQLGKKQLSEKNYKEAMASFAFAKSIESKPTLACFYLGRTFEEMGEDQSALNEYRLGRSFQKFHYQCLTGEFDLLCKLGKYSEAVTIAPILTEHFPLTPERLAKIFTASICTHKFAALPAYYELYSKLEVRPPELVKVVAMAFLTAGRFMLKDKKLDQACKLFEMGSRVSGRDPEFLELILIDLTAVKAIPAARDFLSKVPKEILGTPIHHQLSFRVEMSALSSDELIERGRRLAMESALPSDLYLELVRVMASAGKIVLAETIISQAVKSYPDLRKSLYSILESSSKQLTS